MRLALDEPERFIGLVLASTVCRVDTPPAGAMDDRVTRLREQGPETSARQSAELVFSPRFMEQHPAYINAFIAKRASFPPEPLIAAMQAGVGFDVCGRLATYKGSCVVMAGSADILTKPDTVRHVAASIPGSRFVTVEGAGQAALRGTALNFLHAS